MLHVLPEPPSYRQRALVQIEALIAQAEKNLARHYAAQPAKAKAQDRLQRERRRWRCCTGAGSSCSPTSSRRPQPTATDPGSGEPDAGETGGGDQPNHGHLAPAPGTRLGKQRPVSVIRQHATHPWPRKRLERLTLREGAVCDPCHTRVLALAAGLQASLDILSCSCGVALQPQGV